MPLITQLVVYPVKGCSGVSVTSAVLESTGLLLDRHFCLVRADGSGKFVACRHKPRLLLVKTKLLDKDGNEVTALTEWPSELACSTEGLPPLRLSLARSASPAQQLPITVWDWTGLGSDCGDEAAAWFSTAAGIPVRLLRFSEDARREVDPAYDGAGGHVTAFSDGYPALLASEASMAALNARLAKSISISRFRANIIVDSDVAPFAEDTWDEFTLGQLRFQCLKPCSRCVVPSLDPETAERGDEPNESMATFRTGDQLGFVSKSTAENFANAIFMGQNIAWPHTQLGQLLRVGDPVAVLSRLPKPT